MPVLGECLPEPVQLIAWVGRGIVAVDPLPLARMVGQLESLPLEHRDHAAMTAVMGPETCRVPLVHNPAGREELAESTSSQSSGARPCSGLPVLAYRLLDGATALVGHQLLGNSLRLLLRLLQPRLKRLPPGSNTHLR